MTAKPFPGTFMFSKLQDHTCGALRDTFVVGGPH